MKNLNKWSKAKQKPRNDHLGKKKSRSPKVRPMAQHNRDKMLQNRWLLKVREKGLTPSAKEHN
jgi:hypothetical protein